MLFLVDHGDGAGNTVEENSRIFSLIQMCWLPSVVWHCWFGGRKGIRPVMNGENGRGGHWLVQMECRPARWSVCLPLLIFPCTIKSRSFLLTPAHPDGPEKRVVKRLWCGVWWWSRPWTLHLGLVSTSNLFALPWIQVIVMLLTLWWNVLTYLFDVDLNISIDVVMGTVQVTLLRTTVALSP